MHSRRGTSRAVASALLLVVALGPTAGADATGTATGRGGTLEQTPAPEADSAVRAVVDDYVALYRKDSLPAWRRLFLPTFTSTSPNANGGVTVRTLDEFYDAQARGFARAQSMSETLENVVISRTGRLATAWADFVFHQDGSSRRGRLVLTLVEAEGAWRIAGLLFSY